jgi:hypothetical protein
MYEDYDGLQRKKVSHLQRQKLLLNVAKETTVSMHGSHESSEGTPITNCAAYKKY